TRAPLRLAGHGTGRRGLGRQDPKETAYAALRPAQRELAGAGSGLLTAGPVAGHLDELATALGRPIPHR
ncbi:hypothetical protein ACWGIU_12920, partial [Streptomyces sp. NPDC054840]